MNEENAKIAKLKKSCHAGKIVSNILCIFFAIGCICSIISAIGMWSMGREFDDYLVEAQQRGVIENSDKIGAVSAFEFNLGIVPANIESDIPAVQAAIDDHPMSILYGGYVFFLGLAFAVVSILSKMVSSIFGLIEKENTPFTAKVKKRVTIVLAITSGILLLTTGSTFGILCILLTWVVHNVIDYGMTLQTESDETL